MKETGPVEPLRDPASRSGRAEDLIRAAQAHAERLCELALAQTPAPYHSFIILMEQRKRIGGSEATPIWADIRLPYMSVDGRVRMAIDEHEDAGKHLHIEASFVMDETTGQPLARAKVRSDLRGTAMAHARIFLNGSGPHKSNPVETAETSAVGRALGFLGYGCFGTGIASAEEVAQEKPGRLSRAGGPAPVPTSGTGAPAGGMANPEDGNAREAPIGGRIEKPRAAAPPRTTPQAVFSQINALFEQRRTPGARRVGLMKEYRGREGELVHLLESGHDAGNASIATRASVDVPLEVGADDVPF